MTVLQGQPGQGQPEDDLHQYQTQPKIDFSRTLIRFVNQDEAMRPDGKKGMGLLAYLRSLQSANGHGRRDVIANVFRGVQNRMVSGYLLRDVVNKVNGIHFNSSEEIYTLSHLYEMN